MVPFTCCIGIVDVYHIDLPRYGAWPEKVYPLVRLNPNSDRIINQCYNMQDPMNPKKRKVMEKGALNPVYDDLISDYTHNFVSRFFATVGGPFMKRPLFWVCNGRGLFILQCEKKIVTTYETCLKVNSEFRDTCEIGSFCNTKLVDYCVTSASNYKFLQISILIFQNVPTVNPHSASTDDHVFIQATHRHNIETSNHLLLGIKQLQKSYYGSLLSFFLSKELELY